jgi:hypothetical protein
MFNGWISLRVDDPKGASEWYQKHLGLEVLGTREDLGTRMLGSREHGAALIFPATGWNGSSSCSSISTCPTWTRSTSG